jgi:hypothetical protein
MEKAKPKDLDSETSAEDKKQYVAPKLEALGSFVDLTQEGLSAGMGIDA